MAIAIFLPAAVAWAASRTERDHEQVVVQERERQKKSCTTEQKFPHHRAENSLFRYAGGFAELAH